MSTTFRLTMSAIAVLMIMIALAPMSSAEQVDAPAWEAGDQWGYGDKVYLEPVASEMIESLEEMLEDSGVMTLETAYINGSVEAYMFCNVVSVTDSECVLRVYMASGFDAVANVQARAPVPVEGLYDIWEQPPTQNKTITVHANIEYMVFEDATLTFERSSMALKSIDSVTKVVADVSFSATNLFSQSFEGDKINVTIENYDLDAELNVEANAAITFDPYLDIFEFPIEEGEEWTVSSIMAASGNITGTFDASGLPEGTIEDLIRPEEGNVDLPLDLSTFVGEIGDFEMNAGQLQAVNEEISFEMKCNSIEDVNDDVLGSIKVCEIYVNGDDDPESIIFYSPDINMLAYVEMTGSAIPSEVMPDIGSIAPILFEQQENLKVGAMEPTKAAQGIYDVSGVVVSDAVVPDGDDDGNDGGAGLPMLLIVAVGAVAIVILAIVLIRRK